MTSEGRDFYGDSRLPRLPWLLADGFSDEELKTVVRHAVDMEPVRARSILSQVVNVEQSSDAIAKGLNGQEALQCLLLLDEGQLGRAIDRSVINSEILVPTSETRAAVASKNDVGSWWKLQSQVGGLGIRTVSSRQGFSLIRLQKLLLSIGKTTDSDDFILWEFRFSPGNTVKEKIHNAIYSVPPRDLLRRIALSSAQRLESAIVYLQPMWFQPPANSDEEELLIDRLLWKLGFSVTKFPSEVAMYWARSEKLRLQVNEIDGQVDITRRDSIRSAAVNYFVSLEELLDRSLAFIGWALMHDHYEADQRRLFYFDLDEARRLTTSILNSRDLAEPLKESGHNTLWPLVNAMSRLADYLDEMNVNGRSGKESLRESLPEFANAGAAPFPFKHRIPLYDLSASAVPEITSVLRQSAEVFAALDISNLRNRLEHQRPDSDFPDAQLIREGIREADAIVRRLEETGLLPVLHVFHGSSTDENRRTKTFLSDYAGRVFEFPGPTSAQFSGMPSLFQPQVPLKLARLDAIPDVLRFTLVEKSTFRDKWQNYPRRLERGPKLILENVDEP